MNKFCILAIFAVAVAGVAAASKPFLRPHGGHLEEELEGEIEIQHRGPLGHISDELLIDELRNREHLHRHLPGHLVGFPVRGGRFGKHGGFRRGGQVVGGAAGIGAIGGAEVAEGKFGAIGASSHAGKRGSIEGKKSGFVAGKKGFEASRNEFDAANDEGIHKHQVINKDKTIISDRTSGVNDVDGFRRGRVHSESNRLGAGAAGVAAGEVSGRAEGSEELDNKFGAVGAQGSEAAIGGAAGAAVGGGAADV